jgi:hypothetical protein
VTLFLLGCVAAVATVGLILLSIKIDAEDATRDRKAPEVKP